ncbi:MAG TPA: hypothetical protein VM123_17650 [archaeon]|nr:hypothetical protein [archaeon]
MVDPSETDAQKENFIFKRVYTFGLKIRLLKLNSKIHSAPREANIFSKYSSDPDQLASWLSSLVKLRFELTE